MNRARIVEDAEIKRRAILDPHITVNLFRALDLVQPLLDLAESNASGTPRYPITSAAIEAGRQALRGARGQS